MSWYDSTSRSIQLDICGHKYGLDLSEWERLSWWQKLRIRFKTMFAPCCGVCIYERDRACRLWLGKSLLGKEYDCFCRFRWSHNECHCQLEDGQLTKRIENKKTGKVLFKEVIPDERI